MDVGSVGGKAPIYVVKAQERNYKLDIVNHGKYDLVIELHLNACKRRGSRGALYIQER